jgi:hypothetical protein
MSQGSRFDRVLLACALLALGGGACNPSFEPDWKLPSPAQIDPLDASSPPPAMPEPPDAGDDTAMADAASLADGGIVQVRPYNCRFFGCADAGPDCMPVCLAACADVLCSPDAVCTAAGFCFAECKLCNNLQLK